MRAYISKLIVISLLWVGFSLYLAQPLKAGDTDRAFASWLDKVAETSDKDLLLNNYQDLSKSLVNYDHLDSSYGLLFQSIVPFEGDAVDTDRLYKLLLVEWGYEQTAKGMSCVPPTVQPLFTLQLEKYNASIGGTVFFQSFEAFFTSDFIAASIAAVFDLSLTPMAEGIAIGAP